MGFQNFSKYAFLAFLFSLPFQTVFLLREPILAGEKWQYGTIGLYGTDILLILSVFFAFLSSAIPAETARDRDRGAGIRKDDSGSRVKSGMTTLSLMALVLWSGLSILWAPDQALAGYFFVKLLLGAGAFFLVRSLDEGGAKTAVKVLFTAAVLQSMLAIGQFLSQSTFASTLLGMSAHDAWQAGSSVLKLESSRWLRAYGTFPHPNMLGGFLAITLVIAIADCRLQNAEWQRKVHSPFFILHSSFIILLVLGLILTFSRSAWLGAAMGITAYFVFRIKYHVWEKRDMWMFLLSGMAAAVFVFVLRDQVFPRFDTETIEREGSISERAMSLADAKALIVAHPIVGVGAGNFTAAILEKVPDPFIRPVWSVQPAHNVFTLVFAELGIVGLVLFVSFCISMMIGFRFKNRQSAICNLQSAIPLVLLPSLLLDHWLWSSHFGILFFFLLVGLVSRK